MVVVGSRQEAVRWQLAIDKYIKERGYGIGTLVAFSGEVKDKESGPDPFTETSQALNPNLRGRDIREAFKTDEYQILLVANKFQTGFDQPLLCGMYVDKRLAGIQAVQTLSRLNRAHPGKDTTYVLDFVNDAEDVLEGVQDLLRHGGAGGRHRPEPGLQPAGQAGRRRPLRRFRGRSRRRGGTEAERQAERTGGGRRARRGPAPEALQGGPGGPEDRQGAEEQSRRRSGPGRAGRLAAVQVRHGRVPAALHVPVADLRLRQHGDREAFDLLQAGAAACWSSAASAKGSTFPKWC